jgi:hypothetical protein
VYNYQNATPWPVQRRLQLHNKEMMLSILLR